jgi:hypothetical protein
MGCGQRLLSDRGLALPALVGLFVSSALGQTTQPATQATEWELPDAVRAALAQERDLAFDFDQPGFYAVLEYVKRSPRSPGFMQTPVEVTDWRDLLERPNDFRGQPVTITGVVGRNKAPYALESRRELGLVSQLELSRAEQPLTCTVIFTENVTDIPLNATVTVTGYFVMIRAYYGPSKRVQQAALLVAAGPTTVDRFMPHAAQAGALDWWWPVGAIAVGLVITVIVLWRPFRAGRRDYHSLRASHEAPVSLADDLARWADRERPDDH